MNNPRELVQLIDELDRIEGGLVERRPEGLAVYVAAWEREIAELVQLLNAIKITTLSLGALPMRDGDFALFRSTESWKTLFVSETPVSGTGLDLLPECPNITEANFEDCPLRGNRLLGLRRFPNLKKAKIGWIDDADQGLEYLAGLHHLEYFHITPRPIFTGDGLVHFRGHEAIRRIDLGEAKAIRGMEHLVDCPNLRELNLDDSSVDDAQLRHTSQIRSLTRLFIGSNEISDMGVESLAGHPNLKTIGLYGTGLENKHRNFNLTEQCLASLETIPKLQSVTCYFRVTQMGVDCLKRMKHLDYVSLNWPVMTRGDIDLVSDQLPNCRVYADPID